LIATFVLRFQRLLGMSKWGALNLEEFGEGRRGCPWARGGIEEAHGCAGDQPGNGAERRHTSASFDARQSLRNCASHFDTALKDKSLGGGPLHLGDRGRRRSDYEPRISAFSACISSRRSFKSSSSSSAARGNISDSSSATWCSTCRLSS
jgi:hypothetical protein